MSDAQRYRMNAVECLSAAERSGPPYRSLTFAIAASWLSLAREQEAMDELLVVEVDARRAYADCRDGNAVDFLAEHFTLFGVDFQWWMPIVGGACAI
jgi:hypothetical protein